MWIVYLPVAPASCDSDFYLGIPSVAFVWTTSWAIVRCSGASTWQEEVRISYRLIDGCHGLVAYIISQNNSKLANIPTWTMIYDIQSQNTISWSITSTTTTFTIHIIHIIILKHLIPKYWAYRTSQSLIVVDPGGGLSSVDEGLNDRPLDNRAPTPPIQQQNTKAHLPYSFKGISELFNSPSVFSRRVHRHSPCCFFSIVVIHYSSSLRALAVNLILNNILPMYFFNPLSESKNQEHQVMYPFFRLHFTLFRPSISRR